MDQQTTETSTTGLAVYMRVSGDEQKRQDTIANQQLAAERYLAAYGITPYSWYADNGVSGTIPFASRPEGARLLADIAAGHVRSVLIWRLDRVGRNMLAILQTVETLQQAGVRLVSITESFDTQTPQGKATLGMLAMFAQFERDSIVQRTSEGAQNRLARSPWMGGHAPVGFCVEGEKKNACLAINNTLDADSGYSEVDAVRLAWYLLLEQDWSTERIATHLTQLGIPTRTPGGEWAPRTVYQLFRNPIYKGERHYRTRDGRIIVRPVTDADGVSLALVSNADWDRAQAVLAAHRAHPAPTTAQDHLLYGLMRCGLCGAAYTVNWARRHENDGTPLPRHRYYLCVTRRMRARRLRQRAGSTSAHARDCVAATLDADKVEQKIWADIEEFGRNPAPVLVELAVRAEGEAQAAETLRADLAEIQQDLDAQQAERDNAVTLYTKGRIDERDLDRQLDRIQGEERDITARRDALLAALAEASEAAEAIERARLFLQRLHARLDGADGPLTPALRRETARALIKGIKVETVDDGVSVRGNIKRRARLDITYRFNDPALSPADSAQQFCTSGLSTYRQSESATLHRTYAA